MNKGVGYALAAYLFWGFLPIYWKFLHHVPAQEILMHRITWSFVFLLLVLLYKRSWGWLGALRDWRVVLTFLTSSSLLSLNWGLYIWAVNAGYIVETSLGYFINPLVNVLLGMLFLQERLRPGQLVAVAFAVAGVGYLTISYGALPWISLTLAFTFGIYGLLRKTAKLDALAGLSLETALLFLPAAGYLVWLQVNKTAVFLHTDPITNLLLMLTGVVTAVPLIGFAFSARQVPLSTMGILQYVTPTLQFLIGVFLYHEPFTHDRLIGFSIIWVALAIYSVELIINGRRRRRLRLSVGD
ncbi:MAG: EamA family transporter RarD [Anaerolineales bacterium]|nr:EamA family transporter RarD [Anaerolineales bacterium]